MVEARVAMVGLARSMAVGQSRDSIAIPKLESKMRSPTSRATTQDLGVTLSGDLEQVGVQPSHSACVRNRVEAVIKEQKEAW